jgi:phage baseplate assembly protein W
MPINVRTYTDFNTSFVPNPVTNDILKVTGANSVVQALINLIQLSHYDKPFHPEIGSNIRKLLFEQLDMVTAAALEDEIKTLIANYEPRVTTKTIIVQSNSTLDGYDIEIEFEVYNIATSLTINTFLERLR